MQARWVLLGCALSACGRIDFGPNGAILTDAGGDGDGDGDGSIAPCTEPWGPETAIPTGLQYPYAPWLTADGSTLYFSSIGTIYTMARLPDGSFAAPVAVVFDNRGFDSDIVSLTDDGLLMTFTSSEMGGAQVRQVTRPDALGAWGNNVDTSARGGARVFRDGLTLVVQDFNGPIELCTRATVSDIYACDVLPATINSGAQESSPALSHDGLDLYFNRQTFDIHVAHRDTTADAFAGVTMLPFEGQTPAVSANGRSLLYALPVNGGTQNQIYIRTRCGG